MVCVTCHLRALFDEMLFRLHVALKSVVKNGNFIIQ